MNRKKQRSADCSRIWKLGQVLARAELSKTLRGRRLELELEECRQLLVTHSRGIGPQHQDFVDLVHAQLLAAARLSPGAQASDDIREDA